MTMYQALKKITNEHGITTYAEVYWAGRNLPSRLDLELTIEARDHYEVYGRRETPPKKCPFPKFYRISKEQKHDHIVTYDIYHVDKDGVLVIDATIDVYPDFVYENYDWKETFGDTSYPRRGIPWWKIKELY